MTDAVQLADDQIRALIGRLAALDMGSWARPDVERALDELGWSFDPDDGGPLFGPGGGRGLSLITDLPMRGHASTGSSGSRDGIFELIVPVTRTKDRDRKISAFKTTRRLVEELLWPAAWRGGGGGGERGPWIRWRRPTSTVELRVDLDTVVLGLFSTKQVEETEYRAINYAEDGYGLPHCWYGIPDDLDRFMNFFPSEHRAAGWAEFEKLLADTLLDLVSDVPYFGDATSLTLRSRRKDTRWVHLEIEDNVLALQAPAMKQWPNPVRTAAFTEMGWTPPGDFWTRDFPDPGQDATEAAARLTIGALQALDVRFPDVWQDPTMEGTTHLGLPRLGV
jgi:hypothetical protein